MISIWGEEKHVTILQNKDLSVNCEDICYIYIYIYTYNIHTYIYIYIYMLMYGKTEDMGRYGVTLKKLTQRQIFLLDI